jgi:hypothetical protein
VVANVSLQVDEHRLILLCSANGPQPNQSCKVVNVLCERGHLRVRRDECRDVVPRSGSLFQRGNASHKPRDEGAGRHAGSPSRREESLGLKAMHAQRDPRSLTRLDGGTMRWASVRRVALMLKRLCHEMTNKVGRRHAVPASPLNQSGFQAAKVHRNAVAGSGLHVLVPST